MRKYKDKNPDKGPGEGMFKCVSMIETGIKEKEKELQVLKSKAEIEKKSNQEEFDRLAEEKKILEEELQNLNMASKETQQSHMMKILEMVSEDDIDYIDDILAATENYIGKVANKMLKVTKKQFNNFWK